MASRHIALEQGTYLLLARRWTFFFGGKQAENAITLPATVCTGLVRTHKVKILSSVKSIASMSQFVSPSHFSSVPLLIYRLCISSDVGTTTKSLHGLPMANQPSVTVEHTNGVAGSVLPIFFKQSKFDSSLSRCEDGVFQQGDGHVNNCIKYNQNQYCNTANSKCSNELHGSKV
jgi:hypothetical protein